MPFIFNNLECNKNQILNPLFQVLATAPSSPAEGQFYYNSTNRTVEFRSNTAWIALGRLDQISAPTADVAMNSHKITGLATPTSSGDAATKGYVDGLSSGVASWKNAVRVASTANVSLSTAPSAIDGVTLSSADRILLKDQTAGAENGIYVYDAPGNPLVRATDADASAEVKGGMAMWVDEGTANSDTAWVLTTNGPITLGTTALVFVQFSGLGQVVDGAGLSKSGNTLSVNVDGATIEISSDALRVKAGGIGSTQLADASISLSGAKITGTLGVANGGTGGTTQATARSGIGAITKVAADITGDGSTTSFTVTHNLNTRDVQVVVRETSTNYNQIYPDVRVNNVNSVDIVFGIAPVNALVYRVIVEG